MRKGLLVIIDDESDILDLLEYNFAKKGFEVEVFNRALPALSFIEEHQPSVILCDWMMPGMTGIELCQHVKKHSKLAEIPFVMVTCRNESEAKRVARAEGVADYIVKPIKIDELIHRIEGLLSQYQAGIS